MKKTRLAAAAVVIASSSLFGGIALAGGRYGPSAVTPASTTGVATACAAIHNTPAMAQMHATMSAAMQSHHTALHTSMNTNGAMGNAAGMDHGSSTTPAPPTSSGTIDPHHSSGGTMTGGMG